MRKPAMQSAGGAPIAAAATGAEPWAHLLLICGFCLPHCCCKAVNMLVIGRHGGLRPP